MLFVVDFGGGTLDISVIENKRNKNGWLTQVKAVGGSANLGGNDFDKAIYNNILIPAVINANGINYRENMSSENLAIVDRRMTNIAEQIKFHFQNSSELFTEEMIAEFDNEVNISASYEEYKDAVSSCVSDAKAAINDVLDGIKDRFNILPNNMKVIIVGGMAKERQIRDYIASLFGTQNIIGVMRPITAVAEGASRYAVERSNNTPAMLSSDIGIMETVSNQKRFFTILEKNTILNAPVSKSVYVGNAFEGSSNMNVEVYERNKGNMNHYKTIVIPTDRAPIGANRVKIDFVLDTNRILTVSACYVDHEYNCVETIAVQQ